MSLSHTDEDSASESPSSPLRETPRTIPPRRGSLSSTSAFPAARIGGTGQAIGSPTATGSNDLLSPRPTSTGQHHFGSVPASSTSVIYPGVSDVVSTSPAGSPAVSGTPAPVFSGTTSAPKEYDPEFVRTIGRHLVSPKPQGSLLRAGSESISSERHAASVTESSRNISETTAGETVDADFYSLTLQGGDITRELYNWQRQHEESSPAVLNKRGRSHSFTALPRPAEDDSVDIHNIHVPGGFRRNFILSKAKVNQDQHQLYGTADEPLVQPYNESSDDDFATTISSRPFLTRNFLEFLSVYGHFAGEELEDEDEVADIDDAEAFEEDGSYDDYEGGSVNDDLRHRIRRHLSRESTYSEYSENGSLRSLGEEAGLLRGKRYPGVHRGHGNVVQDTSATKAVLLLLKGFVGTGVLFLPKAYYNGGILFSSAILFFVAVLTYYCFILLIDSRMVVQASFGDMGGILYGKKMRLLILTSIVLSQIGFAAAYTVFTSENLQAFILAITDCQVFVPVRYLIFAQMAVFVPLAMVRNISKLSVSALIADFFILLGLAYVYFWDGKVLIERGISNVTAFNSKDWTLFIGTAIFTFEGIGLVIPIHESMTKPKQFYSAIGIVMAIITVVYITMGTMSYAAYGSNVETVVILNMPQDNRLVNSVQFIYAAAILLSTPLQLFPAIRIMENAWFIKSGKHDMRAKWHKNIFRAGVVLLTAFVAWGGADDLDKFVALIGSLACIPLTYIYPPLLHYKACATSIFNKSFDVFICIFGLGSMLYTTYGTIQSWATSMPDNDFFRYCS
ncbi:transmembrane amino acid transporter protein-domain-containing protein [Lipomyces japonicus]|uniref:transmembrane amino acid transporter protein-domain-containing protein n=1 Tax=Lipomyces japonicus TaxID=56871 RepID=UPI0034CFF29E